MSIALTERNEYVYLLVATLYKQNIWGFFKPRKCWKDHKQVFVAIKAAFKLETLNPIKICLPLPTTFPSLIAGTWPSHFLLDEKVTKESRLLEYLFKKPHLALMHKF